METDTSIEIIELDFRNEEHIEAAAELHAVLLKESPVVQLGHAFMTKFYYKVLVENGLVSCDLCQYKGKYVGFLAYTKYPFTFMREGGRRYFFYLSFLLLKSISLKPMRIKAIFKTMAFKQKRELKNNKDRIGEVLSLGVLNSYSTLRDKKTGLRISNLLLDKAIDYFKNEGFKVVQAEVNKNNKPSLFLFHSYGGAVKGDSWSKEGEYLVRIEL